MAAAPLAGDLIARGVGEDISAEGRHLKRAAGEQEARNGAEKDSSFHAHWLVQLGDEPVQLG